MSEVAIKLCVDCRFLMEGGRCGHESAVVMDYVHGQNTRYDAQRHRTWNGEKDCGRDARFFEPLAGERQLS